MGRIITLIILAALLFLPSCLAGGRPDEALVKQNKIAHATFSKVLAREMDDDPSNDPDWKGLDGRAFGMALKAWGVAIQKAEELLSK